MKTQGVINPLGEIIAHDVTFEPNVNVYDRTAADGIERVIRIECPGVQQEDIDWEAGTVGYCGVLWGYPGDFEDDHWCILCSHFGKPAMTQADILSPQTFRPPASRVKSSRVVVIGKRNSGHL